MTQSIYEEEPGLLAKGGNAPFRGGRDSDFRRKAPLIYEMDPPASRAPNPGLITEEEPDVPAGQLSQSKPKAPSQEPRQSGIRKDGFFSYFNPLNWFKWGKEKKLARQAAKAIADPSSAPEFTMTAAHTKALNTTHGQKILKSAAKDSLKADNDPLSKVNYRRAEGRREDAHVGENSRRKPVNPQTDEEKWKHEAYGTMYEGPEPDIAQIMQTFKRKSYAEWKESEDAQGLKADARLDAKDRKLAGSNWGSRHARAFREAHQADKEANPEGAEPGERLVAAAREKHQANRQVRSLLKDNRDLPPIMHEMWGEKSPAVKASQQWRNAMQPKVDALNLRANLPWGQAFKGTAYGFQLEEDRINDAPEVPTGESGHKSYETLRESGVKAGRPQESIDVDDDEAEVGHRNLMMLQTAVMKNQLNNQKPNNEFMSEGEDSDDEDLSNSFSGKKGKQVGYNFQSFLMNQLEMGYDD